MISLFYGGSFKNHLKFYNFGTLKFNGPHKCSPKIDEDDMTDGQTDRQTQNLDWTPLVDKYIVTLDLKLEIYTNKFPA